MKYIKNKQGILKTILVDTKEENNFDTLNKLSIDSKAKVYLIPENTSIQMDDNGWLISANGNSKDIWLFLKGWETPYDCFVNGFPFPLKMKDMWYSDIPVEQVPIDDIKWVLKYPWWNTEEELAYNLVPEDVLNDIDMYWERKKRIEDSDTQYPLLLVKSKQDRWLTYDGVHRLLKQILEGKESVPCKKFDMDMIEDYIHEEYRTLIDEWKVLEYR